MSIETEFRLPVVPRLAATAWEMHEADIEVGAARLYFRVCLSRRDITRDLDGDKFVSFAALRRAVVAVMIDSGYALKNVDALTLRVGDAIARWA